MGLILPIRCIDKRMYIDIFLQSPVGAFLLAAITSLSHILFCFHAKLSEYVFMLMEFTFEISHLQRYMADIGKSWPVLIVCGGFLPLFLSVVWLLLIRHFVAAMPWITVALFNVLIISVTMFYYLKGES